MEVASPTLGRAPGVPLVTIVRVPELRGEFAPAVRAAVFLVSTFQSNGYNVSTQTRVVGEDAVNLSITLAPAVPHGADLASSGALLFAIQHVETLRIETLGRAAALNEQAMAADAKVAQLEAERESNFDRRVALERELEVVKAERDRLREEVLKLTKMYEDVKRELDEVLTDLRDTKRRYAPLSVVEDEPWPCADHGWRAGRRAGRGAA